MNCAIIYYTSNTLDTILVENKTSKLYQFMIIVMIEHIIIAFKFFLVVIIVDKPSWVTKQEIDIKEGQEELNALLEKKKFEHRVNHGEILED